MEAQNAHFVMLIAPRKPTIYPEKLPFAVVTRTEIDPLLEAAEARGIDRILYPRDELLAAKRDQLLYGPFDTHWNEYGGHVAYTALMNRLQRTDASLTPLPRDAFKVLVRSSPGDLASMLGLGTSIPTEHPTFAAPGRKASVTYLSSQRGVFAPKMIQTGSASSKTLLLIRDSFSAELIPFLSASFGTIVVVHYADGYIRQDLIDRFRPDVVVLEVIEPLARYAAEHLHRPAQEATAHPH